ncbi:hypothetical protein AB0F36_23105 [Streptomyces sp. NPDC029080]|uniref:hypothetical protein n=1 Tax=Streptomyces sp. NPDC029080 TaxID=3155017 RepID=UPI0033C2532F
MAHERPTYVALGHCDDFGLTGLAERLCAVGRRLDRPSALAVASGSAAGEDEEAVQLGEDARRLLGSPLSERVLHTVWLAAVGGCYDPARHGGDTRAWLTELSESSIDRIRRTQRSFVPPPVRPVRDGELCRAVVARIREQAADLDRTAPGLARSLEQVVEEADAGLGFRLFLRALKVSRTEIGKDRYDLFLDAAARLGYPQAVVHDGLLIAWPPVDTRRQDAYDDFGLSALAERFAGPWYPHTARETVDRHITWDGYQRTPGSEAAILLQDVRRMLESALTTQTITTLWQAATGRSTPVELTDTDVRRWLHEVAGACGERLRSVAPAYTPVPRPPDTEMTAAVRGVLRKLAPGLADRSVSPSWQPVPGTAVLSALEQAVVDVDCDLGFRLLLRALVEMRVPLTEEWYTECESLAGRFGYGEFHLLGVEQRAPRD